MNARIFKCFIASPSDTVEERESCDNVFRKINKTLGEQLNFRIESIKWENDSRPSFGKDGQDVINKQLLSNFEIFIGIMWNRFGAATPRANSGTEEEFNYAYRRYIEQDDVEIMFYFKNEKVDVNSLDLEQVNKVREFKEKVADLGGLYSSFGGEVKFEEQLYNHLYGFFIQKLSKNTNNKDLQKKSEELKELALKETITFLLKKRLDEALCLFSGQPIVWVEPTLSSSNDISINADDNYKEKIDLNEIIDAPQSYIINSPPQFGLTSLSHYFILEAWKKDKLWIYLDAKKVKRNSVEKSVKKELKSLNLEEKKIECIILDSWSATNFGALKMLKNLSNSYKDIPIIVMQTIDDNAFNKTKEKEKISREFKSLHLLALHRTQIRKFVSAYNSEKQIGDDNIVLEKVIKDLESLNIHRTATNCLTLLKVSEKHFDESPVNRTKMIEMVLFVLFDLGDLPTYKIKPDLKDSEYVLGRFCENMIRNNNYTFSRDFFINELTRFCDEKLIDLEVSIVFDILYNNHIIVPRDSDFSFRATFWIFYFAAKRMHINSDFKDYILNEKRYVDFPEIIEFYTGVDRNRKDALIILAKDINDTLNIVKEKTGLPDNFNPLEKANWQPSVDNLIEIQEEISDDIIKSKLPDVVKDHYADKNYNQLRPYNQDIHTIFEEYSLAILMQKIKASSRALRNSDYVEPEYKKEMLNLITESWNQVLKILFALTPVLASKEYAFYDGIGFILADNFGATFEEKMNTIIQVLPTNVVGFFKDDIFSKKIGPLLYENMANQKNDLIKHQLALLITFGRPRNWKKNIESYIDSIPKNSYYLFDMVNTLLAKYKFDFASEDELQEIKYLVKKGIAKHELGINKPTLKNIRRVSNQIFKRDVEE